MKTFMTLLVLFHLAQASAQTPAPTPFVDPHPYQSQTWYRLSNGLVKTLSATPGDLAYQFEQPNALPATYAAGSNFGIFKNASGYVIAVVDAFGRFYQYGKTYEPGVVGGVFFTKKGTNELMVVDSEGAVLETTIVAPAMKLVGGNYFIDQNGVLTTIRSMGMGSWNWAGMITTKTGMTIPQALYGGGNYFVDVNGKVTTVASTNGFFSDPIALPQNAAVKELGGNYLIGSDLKLYTVDEQGNLKFARQLTESPTVKGYSYLIFKNQKFLYVKGDGSVYDQVTNTVMSGKPTTQATIDFTQIQAASITKVGGSK
jgi:hypothetical protein